MATRDVDLPVKYVLDEEEIAVAVGEYIVRKTGKALKGRTFLCIKEEAEGIKVSVEVFVTSDADEDA